MQKYTILANRYLLISVCSSVKAVCIALLQKTSEPQYAEAGEAAAEMPLRAVPFKPAFVSLESCYKFRVLEWRLDCILKLITCLGNFVSL